MANELLNIYNPTPEEEELAKRKINLQPENTAPIESPNYLTQAMPSTSTEMSGYENPFSYDLNASTPVSIPADLSTAAYTDLSPSSLSAGTLPTSIPTTLPAKTEYERYWGTPVGTEKYNIPLDKFVQIAGLASKYLDPNNPIANDLIKMGGEASSERARREYEGPNKLLMSQVQTEQLRKLRESAPEAWDVYFKAEKAKGLPDVQIVENYRKLQKDFVKPSFHYTTDPNGNTSVWADGKLVSGSGKGKDVTSEVTTSQVNDKGVVTFFNKQGGVVGTSAPGVGKTKTEKESSEGTWYNAGTKVINGETFLVQSNNKTGKLQYTKVEGPGGLNPKIDKPPMTAEQQVKDTIAKKVLDKLGKNKSINPDAKASFKAIGEIMSNGKKIPVMPTGKIVGNKKEYKDASGNSYLD
jgi:hypothetical protein